MFGINRKVGKAALSAGAAALILALGAPGRAEASNGTVDGCPSGAVCIYPQDQHPDTNPHPQVIFYSYGYHNLSNMWGYHYILNNQYGGAKADVCHNYGGTNCDAPMNEDDWILLDLGPYNSVVLIRP
jgi:hypothetical protein